MNEELQNIIEKLSLEEQEIVVKTINQIRRDSMLVIKNMAKEIEFLKASNQYLEKRLSGIFE